MRNCFSKALAAFFFVVTTTSVLSQNVIIENEYVRAGVNLSTGTLGSGGSTRPGLQYDNTGTRTFPCSSSKQQKDDVATSSWFIRGMMRF